MKPSAITTPPPADTLERRVRAQAAAEVAMPRWFWAAAPVVVVAAALASAVWPWGVAP